MALWTTGCSLWLEDPAPAPEPAPAEPAGLADLRGELEAVVAGPHTTGLQVAWIRNGEVETLRLGTLATAEGGLEIGPVSQVFTGRLLWEANLKGHGNLPNTGLVDAVTALVDSQGTSYEELLQHWVAEPLELAATGVTPPESHVAGHTPTGEAAPPQPWSDDGPLQGLTSSLDDVVVMMQQALATERAPLGWVLSGGEQEVLEQSGTTPGFFSFVRVDQQADIGVAMLADVARPELHRLGVGLMRRARGQEGPLGLPEAAEEVPAPPPSDCVGTFDLRGTPLTVTQDEAGALFVQMGDGDPTQMQPGGPDIWSVTDPAARFTCVRDAQGVKALEVVREGTTAVAPRSGE